MRTLMRLAGLCLLAISLDAKKPTFKPFMLPPLPYAECALKPFVDTETMHLHHKMHHQKYVDNLNAAVRKDPALYTKSLEELVKEWPRIRADIRENVRNNAGGHLNHSLFWLWMTPQRRCLPSAWTQLLSKRLGAPRNLESSLPKLPQKYSGAAGPGFVLIAKATLS